MVTKNCNGSEEMNSTEESIAGAAAIYYSLLRLGVLLPQIWILHPVKDLEMELNI